MQTVSSIVKNLCIRIHPVVAAVEHEGEGTSATLITGHKPGAGNYCMNDWL